MAEMWLIRVKTLVINYTPKIIVSILLLLAGWWAVTFFIGLLRRIMYARDVDATLRPFLLSLISVFLKVVLVITVTGILGIGTTSLVTVLGAAGLAIGLALQGSLSNFAGGVLILLFKPFRVGDYIETGKYTGSVQEIQVLYTVLFSDENKKIIIPNGTLSNNPIENYSANDNRMVEVVVYVDPSNDLVKVKDLLQKMADRVPQTVEGKQSIVRLREINEKGMKMIVRVWVPRAEVLNTQWHLWEDIKHEFDKNGIVYNFNQMTVNYRNFASEESKG